MRVLLTVLAVQTPVKHFLHPSIASFPSLPFRSPSCHSPQCFQVVDDLCLCVCTCVGPPAVYWLTWARYRAHWGTTAGWVDGGREGGVRRGLPLSLWCVTSTAALSPTNGAVVEPCKESPAEVLFESAWGQWGTAGSVWSTSVDVGRMSTASLTTNDHLQSTQTVGIC